MNRYSDRRCDNSNGTFQNENYQVVKKIFSVQTGFNLTRNSEKI